MGTAHMEGSMQVDETQQQVIYVILKDDFGHTTVEGCYISQQKADLRLAVLRAEVELNLAKAREKYPDENLDHNDVGSYAYWILPEKLIR
jgi:hypothetical protein